MTSKIKLFDPIVGIEEEKVILKVLKSKFWASGAGTGYVSEFEKQFRNYVKSDECIAVNNGSSALNLALSLIDIRNKEVILPSLTFVSTANAIIENGGKPVFAEVNDDLCLNVNNIEKLISKKTKIILPVHFGGFPGELDKFKKICKDNSLYLIEDAAHASGTSYKKKKIGKHGFAVCFSFHPVKNLAMPTGGMISINDKNHIYIRKKLLAKRWCGITERKNFSYDVKEIGGNYYMNEFSAAIGLVQLKKLDKLNRLRKNIAKKFCKEIINPNKMSFSKDCSYHLYWILVKNRKQFMEKLSEKGIETGIHYRPIHTMTLYKNNHKLPKTEEIGKKIVSLPIHPNLTEEDIDKIITNVNKYAKF